MDDAQTQPPLSGTDHPAPPDTQHPLLQSEEARLILREVDRRISGRITGLGDVAELAESITQVTERPRVITPGPRTTEFWLCATTTVASLVGMAAGVLPARYGAIAAAMASGLYAVARGLAKLG